MVFNRLESRISKLKEALNACSSDRQEAELTKRIRRLSEKLEFKKNVATELHLKFASSLAIFDEVPVENVEGGRTIDHLLLSNNGLSILIESRHFRNPVKIKANGQLLRKRGGHEHFTQANSPIIYSKLNERTLKNKTRNIGTHVSSYINILVVDDKTEIVENSLARSNSHIIKAKDLERTIKMVCQEDLEKETAEKHSLKIAFYQAVSPRLKLAS